MTRNQLGVFVETAWLLLGGAVVALALLLGLYWITFVAPSAAELESWRPLPAGESATAPFLPN